MLRDNFVYAPSKWETMWQCNIVSYWLGAYTKWSLYAKVPHCKILQNWVLLIYSPNNCLGDSQGCEIFTGVSGKLDGTIYKNEPIFTGLWHSALALSWWCHQMETYSVLLALCAGIHRSPVNSPHNGQWPGALMYSLICAWINAWVNNREASDLRHHLTHYDVIVMF